MSGGPNFHFLMRDLAHEVDAGRLSDIEAAGQVAEAIQKTLKCLHVTFWGLAGEAGQRVMSSIAAYDGERRLAVAGKVSFPEVGGGFYDALMREGFYICPDTYADPVLVPVKETMLDPFRIRALLAASYGGNGEVWGFVTCTNPVPRQWRAGEIASVRKCAAEVSALRVRRRALGTSLTPGGFIE